MGVKYSRDYKEIVQELMDAIQTISNYYEFFGMNLSDWEQLTTTERSECSLTLADDIFYGLGHEESMRVGDGIIEYERDKNIITIFNNQNIVKILL